VTYGKQTIVGLALVAAVLTGVVVASRQDERATTAAVQKGAGASGTDRSVPSSVDPELFRDIATRASPMVVNIRTESRRQTRDVSEFFGGNELFEQFFGAPGPSMPREQILQGAGTGFILDKSGLILTNNHVVAGATGISVGLFADEGEEYQARVVGRDPLTDSALIQLTDKPGRDLPVASLGRSADMQPGEWVMAIGNPFNLAHTVTVGVISAVGRPFPIAEGRSQEVLQTDAAINPGNSGGPLLNVRGEVIGINTAIYSTGLGGNVGVGFAVPIDTVTELIPALREGNVTRGRMGVQITPVTKELVEPLGLKEAYGALVRVVDRDGPAARAGIRPGDVIVSVDGKRIEKSDQLVDLVARTKPGTTLPVDVVREGRQQTLRVTVEELQFDDGGGLSSGKAPESSFGMMLGDLTTGQRSQLALPSGKSGALIASVQPGSPAARSGLRPGDVILEVNRKAVGDSAGAARALRDGREGAPAFLLVWRDGQEHFITMSRD